jgi:hypothetical protein
VYKAKNAFEIRGLKKNPTKIEKNTYIFARID